MPKASSRNGLSRFLLSVTLQVVTVQAMGADVPTTQYFSCEGLKSSTRKDWGEKRIFTNYKKTESMVFFRYNVPQLERKVKGVLDFADSGRFEVCFEEVHSIYFARDCYFQTLAGRKGILHTIGSAKFDKVTGRIEFHNEDFYEEGERLEASGESIEYKCVAVDRPVVK
jgi:hypothetical protein